VLHGGAGGAAPVADLVEEAQLAQAELAGDGDLGVAVHGEGDQAVHVGGGQAGVGQGRGDRLDGQPKLAAPGVLGELGGADAGDRRPGRHQRSPAGPRRTVAVT
jgi:hypothetical protein